jgi:hypothetical protein
MRIYTHIFGNADDEFPCFGNNIFRYFAFKIIQHHYEKTEVFNESELVNPILVNCDFWRDYGQKLLENKNYRNPELFNRDILVKGHFQDDVAINIEREFIRGLFHENNHDSIVKIPVHIRVSDVSTYKIQDEMDEEDIVLHLRLSDFKHRGGTSSEIIHPFSYFSILDNLQWRKVIVVVKPLTDDFESKYLELFKRKYGDRVIFRASTELLNDFNYLRLAKRLIISNSTFCWIAGFLGYPKESYVIVNRYYTGQRMGAVSDNSHLCPIEYISPDQIYYMFNNKMF